MRILAVDTSCYLASAAIVEDGVCRIERFADTDRRHAESVLPLIDQVLEESGLSLADIDALAVDVGPGSFTGVRIGVAAVNAIGASMGKNVIPVDALRTLYEGADAGAEDVLALIDAGNGNVYGAAYRNGACVWQPDAATLAEGLSHLVPGGLLVGDAGERKTYPSAGLVGKAAFSLLDAGQKAVKPLYLRPSQAERLFLKRMEAAKA